MRNFAVRQVIGGEYGTEIGRDRLKVRLLVKIDEQHPMKILQLGTPQRVFRQIQCIHDLWGSQQLAVQVIGPRMIGADKTAGMALLLQAYPGTTVPTHIDECIYLFGIALDNDDGLTRKPGNKKITDFRYLALMTYQYPGLEKDPFDLDLEYIGTAIKALRQRMPGLVPGNEFVNSYWIHSICAPN